MRSRVDVLAPLFRRFGRRLAAVDAVLAHMGDAAGNPLDVLLDRHGHVAKHRRASRHRYGEEIRKVWNLQPEIGPRPGGPRFAQGNAVAAAEVDLQERPRHRVEAGGEDDDVQRVFARARLDAGGGNALDRLGTQVHQRDVVAVEGIEIVGVDRRGARCRGGIDIRKRLGGFWILDDLADLALDEFGSRVVRRLVEQHVVEARAELQAAFLPRRLVDRLPLGFAHVERLAAGDAERMAVRRRSHYFPDLVVVLANELQELFRERRVARGHAVLGSPLEYRQVGGSLGDDRGRLDAGRARPDLADALAAEIDALARPLAGVVPAAGEALQARDLRDIGRREATHRGDEIAHAVALACFGNHVPAVRRFVVVRGGDAGAEADVAAKRELFRHVVEIPQDLGRLRIALRPAPFLEQLFGKEVAVGVALRIAARARIAVPVPRAAKIGRGFQNLYRKAQPVAQAKELVQAGETGADDQCVEVGYRFAHLRKRPNVHPVRASAGPERWPIRAANRALHAALRALDRARLLRLYVARLLHGDVPDKASSIAGPSKLRHRGGAKRHGSRHSQRPPQRRPGQAPVGETPAGMLTWAVLTEQLANAIQLGVMLFLAAAGLTLVFGIMNFINLAHGSLYMLGAFVGASTLALTRSFVVAICAGAAAAAAMAAALEWSVLRRLYSRDHNAQVLATFGLILFFNEAVRMIWGDAPLFLSIPRALDGTVPIAPGVAYSAYRLTITLLGLIAAAAMAYLIVRTRLGARIRAGASNREMLQAMGVDARRLSAFVFALGGALAGLAGALTGPIQSVQVGMGEPVLILAFVVIVIGGMGSVRGAFVGSMLVGLVDTAGRVVLPRAFGYAAGPALASMAIFLLMAAMLYFRPAGLFP